jgi:hypothetical protein
MNFQIVDTIREDTLQSVERRIDQWRVQVRSLGLPPDEHLRPEFWEEINQDGAGNVQSHWFGGTVVLSDEALTKIKQ